MYIETAKKAATRAGLVLYWSTEWRSWGLCDPDGSVESLWMSSRGLKNMSDTTFKTMFIDDMVERISGAIH